jgi:hypothetical protein
VGTSTLWSGPGGGTAAGRRWRELAPAPGYTVPAGTEDGSAGAWVAALHAACRADPEAFGLRAALLAAAGRLAAGTSPAGSGGTLADAAVRRAAAACAGDPGSEGDTDASVRRLLPAAVAAYLGGALAEKSRPRPGGARAEERVTEAVTARLTALLPGPGAGHAEVCDALLGLPAARSGAGPGSAPDGGHGAFWWRAFPKEHPRGEGWRAVDGSSFREREDRLVAPPGLYGAAPPWADDLLRVARAAFLADRLVPRAASADRWTRRLTLSVPVTDPARWEAAAGPYLEPLLTALTGDVWRTAFRPAPPAHRQDPFPGDEEWRAEEVALFSGAPDALGWAARRAADRTGGRLLLVTFSERQLHRRVQEPAYEAVLRVAARPVRHLVVGTPTPRTHGGAAERSARSRALLCTVFAVRAAAAERVAAVHVPVDGHLALNPPPTAARAGALSARPAHPWTLHLLSRLVAAVGGAVRVRNPLLYETPGEVCAAAVATGLGPRDLARTAGCDAPPVRRGGGDHAHCGVCLACLIRRSGLLAAGCGDVTAYADAPWLLPDDHPRAADRRALERWLYGPPLTGAGLLADMPLPPGVHTEPLALVMARSRAEAGALAAAGREDAARAAAGARD